ncbi:hypothetical protein EG68_01558 [Paragonimus skrjabini miyazakii]|uniref:Uncharacterized protein n=1 Tax=Paragonimus skrjabini miyazakii TaxID=59628 RepID=A0A8S9Z2K5_9TREM|nr:hypothetical protein EG68_01558 [Paragonimus skrjabini miyazakii]
MRKLRDHFASLMWILFLGIFNLWTITAASNLNRRICGYGKAPICCPGWHNGLGSPCSIPSCAGNCGDRGRCVQPNTCLCEDKRLRISCEADDEERMQSDQAADTCADNCHGHGRCNSGKCECDAGFSGERCEITVESSCFAKLQRGLCVNPIQHKTAIVGNVTTKLTRELCCNAFGLAWGDPCQPCQRSYCRQGYQEKQRGNCQDINECQIAGVCQNGHCVNMDGTYSCKCPSGYKFDEEVLDCVPQKNACQQNERRCQPGGKCVPIRQADFKCVCDWQYMTSGDQKSCIKKETLSYDICNLYGPSVCENGVCIPRANTYECRCNDGFEASADRKTCRYKIDVCALHRGYLCAHGDCVSLGRDFYCKCDPGYTTSFDRRRCISQCEQLGSHLCPNGQCVTSPFGDYECQCFAGYQSSPDRKHCLPANNYAAPSFRTDLTINHASNNPGHWSSNSVGQQYQHDKAELTNPTVESEKPHSPTYNYYQPQQSHWIRAYSGWHQMSPCNNPQVRINCAGGFCLNLGGTAYRCECGPGYDSVDNGRICRSNSASQKRPGS